jgi:preprotein translocase subunit SecB
VDKTCHGYVSMKLSPVQIIESHPFRISVEYNMRYTQDGSDSELDVDLLLEHKAHIERRASTYENSENPTYFVMLGVRSSEEGLSTQPYSFEVMISGLVTIDRQRCKPDANIDDMAAQYAYTIFFGQIREIITNLTSRMRWGVFVLPTMSFMDAHYKEKNLSQQPS